MIEAGSFTAVLLIFLIAGFIKGVVGLGLPTISLGLMAIFLPLPSAMALVVIPSAVTNFWQACVGGYGLVLLRRFWTFYLSAIVFIWVGGLVLNSYLLEWLPGLLGLLLILHGAFGLMRADLTLSSDRERLAGTLLGSVNGVLTGMTGSFTVPGVLFLQSTQLSRDQLVQAMGILFFLSTLGLSIALFGNGFYTPELGNSSLFALVPALVGMGVGQMVRQRLSEEMFRRIFLGSLIALGIYLIILVAL